MRINKILQKDYTLAQCFYQLKLPLNIDYIIPDNDSVRLQSQFVEEMDISDLFRTYFRIRKNTAMPRQMLKIMIYAYMNKLYSSRSIETACHRDINFMYLLEGSPAPDHATIARFRTLHFAPNANKYTFVWKKAVTKNLAKLLDKLAYLAAVCEEQYGIKITYQNKVSLHQIKKLYRIKAEEGITFVHGIGRRKTPLQKTRNNWKNIYPR